MCIEEFYKQHPLIDEKFKFDLVDVNGAFTEDEIEEMIASSKGRISCVRPSINFTLTPIDEYENKLFVKSIGNRYPGFIAKGREYGYTFIEVYISETLTNNRYSFFMHFSIAGHKAYNNSPKITFSHNIPNPEDQNIYNVSYGFAVSKDDLFPKKFDDYMMLK